MKALFSSYLFFVISLIGTHINAQTENIALEATANTSFVSSWESLEAIHDNSTHASSWDKGTGAYGNWPNGSQTQWVQYEWDNQVSIERTEIYWWTDGGGILIPTEAYLEIQKEGEWVKVANVSASADSWNTVVFDPIIETDQLRLSIRHDTESTGILEWRVWGNEILDEDAPTTPEGLEITSKSIHSASIKWTESIDNYKLAGYNIYVNNQRHTFSATNSTTITGLKHYTDYEVFVTAIDAKGNESDVSNVVQFKSESKNEAYSWPDYPSELVTYNFESEYPDFETPTKILDDCPEVVGEISSDWWVFRWGPERNPEVTDNAINNMLEYYETWFGVYRDQMGWPPDYRARNGYKSAVYLFGSGLCTDDADPYDLGGWQGNIVYDNQNWTMVLASYYPVRAFDDGYNDTYQQEAMVHEGIHSIFTGLPGCRNSAWFHEGANTYLQRQGFALVEGNYNREVGAANFIAPFVPIECYSGWLQDGSFGGPSAEGVYQEVDGVGVCTWRHILGGIQYSSAWPIFLDFRLGEGSIPWIWQNSPNRVLDGMGETIGDYNMRTLITEYRARQALIDVGPWSNSILEDMRGLFNAKMEEEYAPFWYDIDPWYATPYAETTEVEKRVLKPDSVTLPGWSGANQIPLYVDSSRDYASVEFTPLGENMNMILCFKSEEGINVYSEPVSSGRCFISLEKKPVNDVIYAVIVNTDYIYEGEETRKAHFDYRIEMANSVIAPADPKVMWFDPLVVGPAAPEAKLSDFILYEIEEMEYKDEVEVVLMGNESFECKLYPNPVSKGESVRIEISDNKATFSLTDLAGNTLIYNQTVMNQEVNFGSINSGIYMYHIQSEAGSYRGKIVIK